MELNKIYNEDCVTYMKSLPDNSIDLIIADPPYFRVLKQEKWDKFKNFDEYMKWSESYLIECIKKLRLSGTLLLYGCSVSISTMCSLNEILTKNGMYFVEEIIIDKGIKSVAGRISNKIKMLPPVSENIFIYRKDAKPFVKNLLLQKQKEYGLSSKQIKEKLGMPLNGGGNWTKYCGNTEFPLLPTQEHWTSLCNLFDIDIPYSNIEETYNAVATRKIREEVGMVFQSFNLFPHLTVLENIVLAPMKVKKMSRKEAEALGMRLLKRVGLEEKAKQKPGQLSGGQQQRVAIARALAMQPKAMLFDEPTSALDPEMIKEVLDVMMELAKDGMTMLLVTHEMGFAKAAANKIVFMSDGEIIETGTPDEMFKNPKTQRAKDFLDHIL